MSTESVPAVSSWIQNGFHRFLPRFFARHFHAIAVDVRSRPDKTLSDDTPLVVYGNHPSWWDPLVAHYLNGQLFAQRQFFAPIDADALAQYRVFEKLGFYGVKMDSGEGAAAFLKQSKAILAHPGTAIWITPEGRFCDARDHSAELMPGLAHLCHKAERGVAMPLALEYVFWDERLPVCLARLGDPISLDSGELQDKQQWNQALTRGLRQTQHCLAEIAIGRGAQDLEMLVGGKAGAGMFYDTFRAAKSLFTGKRFRSRHGDQFGDDSKQ